MLAVLSALTWRSFLATSFSTELRAAFRSLR
jgi:hypothetical protein